MITIIDLAKELQLTSSALRKAVFKMGINPHKLPRQTETNVQGLNCLTDDQAAQVRKYYNSARTVLITELPTPVEHQHGGQTVTVTELPTPVEHQHGGQTVTVTEHEAIYGDMIARDELTQTVRSAVLTALDDGVEESNVVMTVFDAMSIALSNHSTKRS